MTQEGPGTATLPDVVDDHGDRLEIQSSPAGRTLGAAAGLVLAAAGAALVIIGPGDLAEAPLARWGFGLALVAGGVITFVLRRRRLELDQAGATLHGPFGSRELPWADVDEVGLHETWGSPGGVTKRLGWLNIDMGPGGGGGRRGPGPRVRRRVVSLHLNADGARDLDMPLDGASLPEGEAVLSRLRDRAWLPDGVAVDVRDET